MVFSWGRPPFGIKIIRLLRRHENSFLQVRSKISMLWPRRVCFACPQDLMASQGICIIVFIRNINMCLYSVSKQYYASCMLVLHLEFTHFRLQHLNATAWPELLRLLAAFISSLLGLGVWLLRGEVRASFVGMCFIWNSSLGPFGPFGPTALDLCHE